MKPLLTLLLALILISCAPLTHMNYSVNIADHGTVLCRDYQIRADTIYLMDAGRYINQKHQRNVVDCRAIGFDEILIVEIR